MDNRPAQAFSIAEKLDRLFTTTGKRKHGECSYTAVAESIREEQGISISHTYIWQLRTGRRDNPTLQHLTGLANFFGVPVAYFLDDKITEEIDSELQLLAALRNAGVTEIAMRAADLSSGSREAVSSMINKFWELEGGENR
ncbi:helix-turn-helix domain-containing protein [Streptomyces roseifaciens]|uniref:helix-turn-helix domain-containing protein n=1 Tax=Streptomyces roseifaciens TaxID=1488406 RepID=UPI00071809AD|nr:helix-turn-helix domain-containing protein [Streptomyces roseifaciens]